MKEIEVNTKKQKESFKPPDAEDMYCQNLAASAYCQSLAANLSMIEYGINRLVFKYQMKRFLQGQLIFILEER